MKVDGDDEAKFVFHSQEILAKANICLYFLLGFVFANLDNTKNLCVSQNCL